MKIFKVTAWKLLLLNRFLRKMNINRSLWRIHGNWLIFRDAKKSTTSEIVFIETVTGFYDLQTELKAGDVVLDLGAHIGMFSIPLAKKYPEVLFHCFEANPLIYKNLVHNILANKVRNIVAYNIPVGLEGELVVPYSVVDNTGSSFVNPSTNGNGLVCWDLEHIFQHIGKLPTIIKCDIEGSEYKLFNRIGLLKNINELLIELHPNAKIDVLKKNIEKFVPFNTVARQDVDSSKLTVNFRNGEKLEEGVLPT